MVTSTRPTTEQVTHHGEILEKYLDSQALRSSDFLNLKEWAETYAPIKILVGGDYTLDETLNIKGGELRTEGQVRVVMTQATPFCQVGTAEQVELVSSAPAIPLGSRTLDLPDTSDIKIGDVLFIWNPVDYSYSPWRNYYRQGEAVTVADVGTSRVVLTGRVFDDYPAGCKIIKPTMTKMRVSGDFLITFPQLTGQHTYSPNSVGMLAIQMMDSDFTGFSMKTKQASQAFIIRRSVNCSGKDMNNSQAIYGDATLGLDSGIGVANCQNFHFEGRFSGERHGSSTAGNGEPGSIVTRFGKIGGEILSTSKDAKTAADWHGNVEHCWYYGRIMGVTAGGNFNGVLPGSSIESLGDPNGINLTTQTIGFREMNGCDFKFSGIYVKTQGKPSTTFNGVVDLGATSNQLTTDVKYGGTLDFSGSTFECPTTEHVFKLRSSDFPRTWGVNLSNVVIKSAGPRPIWIAANSGKEADWINLNGIQLNSNCTDPIMNSVSPSMNYVRNGRITATIPAGSASTQVVVPLTPGLPNKYFVNAIALGNYYKPLVISNDLRQASQFRLTVKAADGVNASADVAVDIGYTVIL